MLTQSVTEFGGPIVELELPDPFPTGTEVLVAVTHCGVCHTDLHLQDGYYDLGGGKRANLGDRGILPPLTLGHEIVGTLVAVGPEADIPEKCIGQQFVVYPWIGCGECADCQSGDENLCAAPAALGVVRPGGYAEHCLVPSAKYLVELPDASPAVAATFACSGLTAYSALRKVVIDRERDLLMIVGLGGVGYSALQIARALGYRRIAVLDTDKVKREMLQNDDDLLVIDPSDPQASEILAAAGGVAAAVDFVGMKGTVEFAFSALRKGGTCVVVGLFGGEAGIALPPLVQRSITLRGSYVGTLAELRELLELASSGRLAPLPIEEVPFEEAGRSLDRLRGGAVHGRVVLARGGDHE